MEPDFVSLQNSETFFTDKASGSVIFIRSASVALIKAAFPTAELIAAVPEAAKLSFSKHDY